MTIRAILIIAGAVLTALCGAVSETYAQQWVEEAAMPQSLYSIAAAAAEGDIYIAGGTQKSGAVSRALIRYDVESAAWQTGLPSMEEPRQFAAAAVLGGKLYVIGGRDDDGEVLESVEVFDLATQQWSETEELEEARYGHTAVVLDGKLYVLGGADKKDRVLDVVEVYDPEEGEWEISEDWRIHPPRTAFATVAVGRSAYSFGGISLDPLSHVQRFDFQSGSEVFIPPGLLQARAYVGAVAVGDTSVLVIGGRDKKNRALDEVVRFVPSAVPGLQWQAGPRLRTPRDSFGAVQVDGTAYVIGGRNEDNEVFASMESLTLKASVATENPEEAEFDLEQNYPNPFTTSTRITFTLGGAGEHVQLDIFDLQGRLVHRLVDGYLPSGGHDVEWDGESAGRRAPSGVYVYVLRHGHSQQTKMMTRIR